MVTAMTDSTFKKVLKLEFNSPANFVHKNEGEEALTCGGVYRKAHPNWRGWKIVDNYIEMVGADDLSQLSKLCYNNTNMMEAVKYIYTKNYWTELNLEQIKDTQKAEEILCAAINMGKYTAVKLAQEIVGVKADSILGDRTLQAINSFKGNFDKLYDIKEIEFYERLAEKRPKFKRFLRGWKNRARSV